MAPNSMLLLIGTGIGFIGGAVGVVFALARDNFDLLPISILAMGIGAVNYAFYRRRQQPPA